MRKLGTLETVLSVSPIVDADAIEVVTVRGWNLVSKKGEFLPGDRCLYFELDSALPVSDARFAFLATRGTKTTVEGKLVHVLRTAKMCGVYSQGLAMPLAKFPEFANLSLGEDVSTRLGVELWEPPLPSWGSPGWTGPFPIHLARKTDAERVQNLGAVYTKLVKERRWIATEKIDGTSATFGRDETGLRIAGRNFALGENSLHGEVAETLRIVDRLAVGEVIQGEIYGEGIQGNPLKVRGRHLAIFRFYRHPASVRRVEWHKHRVCVPRREWPEWMKKIEAPKLPLVLPETVDLAIAQVDGMMSAISPKQAAKGVLWQTEDGTDVPELEQRSCFKVISNRYLLKSVIQDTLEALRKGRRQGRAEPSK